MKTIGREYKSTIIINSFDDSIYRCASGQHIIIVSFIITHVYEREGFNLLTSDSY